MNNLGSKLVLNNALDTNRHRQKINSVLFISILCVFAALVALVRLKVPVSGEFTRHYSTAQECNLSYFNGWYYGLLNEAKYTFFLQKTYENHQRQQNVSCNFSSLEGSTTTEPILVGVTFTSLLCKYIMGSYADIILLACALTLSSHVTEFITALKLSDWNGEYDENVAIPEKLKSNYFKTYTNNLVTAYASLQQLANLVNAGVGETLLFFVGEGMFAYAMYLDYLLQFKNRDIVLLFFYLMFITNIFVTSNISRKVGCET
ncbi:unnamed protein product [Orchesella dallaii]|uniref:Uncharacterized protein n=1 Tax=Orchesella dallaii TaxID=48710 RepID=A0ABP1S7N5_9HEXA